ncbi:putative oxidoreductase [Lepidopterella palustris CBS 459.81]|uniref:Putative oxidoreductase n=1 Tax=Lepidopterella palustris CBS 459.81 TaxID=1314670 RepID=A0A8E2JDZ2_9PEZI|nr:putative oxidoreductase [Lepidopterella palustris CBS 459.81]
MSLSKSATILIILLNSLSIEATLPDINVVKSQLKQSGTCCSSLGYFLPGKVHYNLLTDLGYQNSLLSYWSQQEQSIHPACIVIPTSSNDVSLAVYVLNTAYSMSMRECQFAIRSAGHTPQAGAANIDGGITIDLQSLDEVTVSSDYGVASIGTGNRWGNIYPTLDALNLAMIGGRVSDVGVGGLMTGGGVSFFSGRYGFACDNVLNYEVVLASGAIVNANSTSNPSLYRALKGGSNNLGIITRFDVRLFSQGPFWGGTLTQPITNKDAVISFIANFTNSATYDPSAALITNFAWDNGIPLIIHDIEYTKPQPYPPIFSPLFALPQIDNTMRIAPLSSFTTEIAASSGPTTDGRSNLFATLTSTPSEAFMSAFYSLVDATVTSLSHVTDLLFTLTYQPLPYTLYSKSGATGGNVLGLDRFSADFVNALAVVSWALPSDDAVVYAAVQQLFEDGEALAKSMGVWNEFVYLNYAAQWQKPVSGYGETNRAFLEEVSMEVDPGGLFQTQVPGGFKLATG